MFEKPSKQRAIILGGLVTGAISGMPGLNLINCCCCAGILFGGALSYYLYLQEYRTLTPPADENLRVWIGTTAIDLRLAPEASDALLLGLTAGIIGAFLATVINTIVTLAIGPVEQEMLKNWLLKFFERMSERGSFPSEAVEQMRGQFENSMKDVRTPAAILFGLVANLIIYPIFCMLGGLLGHAIFGRRKTIPAVPH
ncbi:MAG: hypothetical protein HY966_00795 [Ignavibacteriales bacterium]|nr:hypothetical protein [Ignavibacteriales bacterium]